MGAVVQFKPELDAFMEASGEGIPLLLDAGHLAFAGGDVLRAIDQHHARIKHVHVKDIRQPVIDKLDWSRQSFLDAVALGATGLAQLSELVTQLRGEAGKRQVAGAKTALAANAGGWMGEDYAAAVVTALQRN
jgi:sugar phosphate isomerase/epimerase